jgi:pyruvate dehydrogenase complex dehydrogenase (E1) component
MAHFAIAVTRTDRRRVWFEIEADNVQAARTQALARAGEDDFWAVAEATPQYAVEEVEEIAAAELPDH